MPAKLEQWCLLQCLVSSSGSGKCSLGNVHEPLLVPWCFPTPMSGIVTPVGQLALRICRWCWDLGVRSWAAGGTVPWYSGEPTLAYINVSFSCMNMAENWWFGDLLTVISDIPTSEVFLSFRKAVWRLEVVDKIVSALLFIPHNLHTSLFHLLNRVNHCSIRINEKMAYIWHNTQSKHRIAFVVTAGNLNKSQIVYI